MHLLKSYYWLFNHLREYAHRLKGGRFVFIPMVRLEKRVFCSPEVLYKWKCICVRYVLSDDIAFLKAYLLDMLFFIVDCQLPFWFSIMYGYKVNNVFSETFVADVCYIMGKLQWSVFVHDWHLNNHLQEYAYNTHNPIHLSAILRTIANTIDVHNKSKTIWLEVHGGNV